MYGGDGTGDYGKPDRLQCSGLPPVSDATVRHRRHENTRESFPLPTTTLTSLTPSVDTTALHRQSSRCGWMKGNFFKNNNTGAYAKSKRKALSALVLITALFGVVRYFSRTERCAVYFGEYRGHRYATNQTVGNTICLLESKWMRISQHSVWMPGSTKRIDDWLFIDYHDRVNVLVEDERQQGRADDRRFFVFRQSKYALDGRESLAVVGGIIEPGEEPENAARREVEEEMRLRCDTLISLGRYRTDVNRGMGWVNSFIAKDCKGRSSQIHAYSAAEEVGVADTERQDVLSFTLAELREAARLGRFLEVQWSNTVALALLHPENSII